MIIKIDDKKFINYNELNDRAEVFSVEQVNREAEEAREKLASIPPAPTDAELLEWARKNYPYNDRSIEAEYLTKKVELADSIKEIIKPIITK